MSILKIKDGSSGEWVEVPALQGQPGFSPLATVTKDGTTATISITDANGTTSTTISDGTNSAVYMGYTAPLDPGKEIWIDTSLDTDPELTYKNLTFVYDDGTSEVVKIAVFND